MSIQLETSNSDPNGSENGLIVRNIPSGIQNISTDGYLSVQELKDGYRVAVLFTATNVAGTLSEYMITLTPYYNFLAGSTATSFTITSGKKLKLQFLTASVNPSKSSGGLIRLKISNSGTVSTSSPTVMVASLGQSSPSSPYVSFCDGINLSEDMQIGLSYYGTNSGSDGVDISLIGYEY